MNTSHLTRSVLLAAGLFTLTGLSFSAHAEVSVKVKNCANNQITVCSYNGKDSSMLVQYQRASFIEQGKGKKLKCKGQGKGGCKLMVIVSDSYSDCGDYGTRVGSRHKGHVLIYGNSSNDDLVEVSSSEYNDSNACDNHD